MWKKLWNGGGVKECIQILSREKPLAKHLFGRMKEREEAALKQILERGGEREAVRIVGGWQWPRFVFIAGFWYQSCTALGCCYHSAT
jgi:hypothetical protein